MHSNTVWSPREKPTDSILLFSNVYEELVLEQRIVSFISLAAMTRDGQTLLYITMCGFAAVNEVNVRK